MHALTYRCPRCGIVSHNSNDAEHKFCGKCDMFQSEMGLLTQDEVNRLADGIAVRVTWSGGNGPADYTIKRISEGVVAAYYTLHGVTTFVRRARVRGR